MSDTPIRTHPVATIEPKPAIPQHAFKLDPDESRARGRGFEVFRVLSGSRLGKQHTVTLNNNNATYWCSCEAGDFGNICRHIVGVAYWRRFGVAWRGFITLDTPDLERRDLDYRRMAKGVMGSYAQYGIDWDALKAVLAERRKEVAA